MESPRFRRALRGAVATAALVTLVSVVPPSSMADPEQDARDKLAAITEKAEQVTEEMKLAQDKLEAAKQELVKADEAYQKAKATADEARGRMGQFQQQVDQFANASYQGAQFNTMSALLTSGSATQFLDQMSALEGLSANNKASLDSLSAVVNEVGDAEAQAADSKERARKATEDETKHTADLEAKKKTMAEELAKAKEELRKYQPPSSDGVDAPPITGNTLGAAALRAAMTRQGAPYVWAAEGPGEFDCSGLVRWAYKQVGVDLPHASWMQAERGVAVSRAQLQAGDLIFYEQSHIHHVGIFMGGDTFFDAQQTGVAVQPHKVRWDRVAAMRHIG